MSHFNLGKLGLSQTRQSSRGKILIIFRTKNKNTSRKKKFKVFPHISQKKMFHEKKCRNNSRLWMLVHSASNPKKRKKEKKTDMGRMLF